MSLSEDAATAQLAAPCIMRVCTLRALHPVARVGIAAAILLRVPIPPLGLKECNSIKCSLGGRVKLQHTSDDGKLSEPGGVPTAQVPSQEICPTFMSLAKDLEAVMETLK